MPSIGDDCRMMAVQLNLCDRLIWMPSAFMLWLSISFDFTYCTNCGAIINPCDFRSSQFLFNRTQCHALVSLLAAERQDLISCSTSWIAMILFSSWALLCFLIDYLRILFFFCKLWHLYFKLFTIIVRKFHLLAEHLFDF